MNIYIVYKLKPLNIGKALLYTHQLKDEKNRFKNNLYRFRFLKDRKINAKFTFLKFNYYIFLKLPLLTFGFYLLLITINYNYIIN